MGIAQAFQPTFSPAPLVKSDETFTRANREFSLSERFAPYSKLSLPVFLPLSLPTTLLSLFLSIFPPIAICACSWCISLRHRMSWCATNAYRCPRISSSFLWVLGIHFPFYRNENKESAYRPWNLARERRCLPTVSIDFQTPSETQTVVSAAPNTKQRPRCKSEYEHLAVGHMRRFLFTVSYWTQSASCPENLFRVLATVNIISCN